MKVGDVCYIAAHKDSGGAANGKCSHTLYSLRILGKIVHVENNPKNSQPYLFEFANNVEGFRGGWGSTHNDDKYGIIKGKYYYWTHESNLFPININDSMKANLRGIARCYYEANDSHNIPGVKFQHAAQKQYDLVYSSGSDEEREYLTAEYRRLEEK